MKQIRRSLLLRVLSSVMVIAVVTSIRVTRVVAEESGCRAGMVEYVQITAMRLDAGEQTFEAFRMLRSGMVEWARWSSSGYLLAHAESYDTGGKIFDGVVLSPSFLNPQRPPQDDNVMGRPAFRLDIATLSGSGVKAVSMNEMPDDIADITDKIRRGVQTTAVPSGWYIWTQPYPGVGKADIDIVEGGCNSAIAMLLSDAVATGRLIVRADEGIQAFISGERANRIAFESRIAAGNLLFGVLKNEGH